MGVDWVPKYITEVGFEFDRLLNDDFFTAIKLLFNNKHYVSAAKLLMSFIDAVGFVEFGDVKENTFCRWLDTYADLSPVGVTSEELWEQRNSLLHMSNLDSRRVLTGKVKRLIFYMGTLPQDFPPEGESVKFYNLFSLLEATAKACSRWGMSFNNDRSKFKQFFERYDMIVSDTRLDVYELLDENES